MPKKEEGKQQNPLFRDLRRRFTAMNMLVISLLMLASFAVVYLLAYNNSHNDITRQLNLLMDVPGRGGFYENAQNQPFLLPPAEDAQRNPGRESRGPRIAFLVLKDEEGAVSLAGADFFLNAEEFDVAAMLQQVEASGKEEGSFRLGDYTWAWRVQNPPEGGQKVAFVETSQSRALLLGLVRIFLLVAALLLGAIWLVSRWFARRSISPIEEAYNSQGRFIQDASHELRTPVAVLKTNLELIESHPEETVAAQQAWLNNMRAETRHMEQLTTNLLALARAEAAVAEPLARRERFSLSDTVQGSILPLEAVLYEKGLAFSAQVAEGLYMLGSRADMERLVHILLENARQYTPEGGRVTLRLWAERRKAMLTVENTGQGIAPEDLPHVFRRFYRADQTRNRESGGYGLGLSIAEGIVHRHGGSIQAGSVPGQLATFTVRLPLAPGTKEEA